MKLKINICLILITLLVLSCKNKTEEPNLKISEENEVSTTNPETSQKAKINSSAVNSTEMIERLQGEWREPEYPFRRAEFENSTVKFTEEGLVEEPKFEEFEISEQCHFDSEAEDIKSTDPFIVMLDDKTCQRIKISNDTLTFSGFSSNTNSTYHITYKKVN